jgi:hypothetical protein
MPKETKAEKRERIKSNRAKMKVSGRSIFTILQVKTKKAKIARGEKI